jgi:hypothetical protein
MVAAETENYWPVRRYYNIDASFDLLHLIRCLALFCGG